MSTEPSIANRRAERLPALRELAEQSNAWPFEEARKIVARLKRRPKDERRDLRDRLRTLGASAHRHLRRGRAHHHGAARLPRAHRRQGQDPPDRVLRRHGRSAQGARQRAQPRDDDAPSRQAALAHSGPVLERVPILRRRQQRAAARLPRPVRLRVRVPVLDRLLHVRPFRRGAPQDARTLRRRDGDHAAVAARGARRRPIRRSCRSRPRAASCCRCRWSAHDAKAGTITYDDPDSKEQRRRRSSPAAAASCNGSRTGRCAGSRSASTTRWPART